MANEQKIINDLLGEEVTQRMLQELGIHNSAKEQQEKLLVMLGENLLQRIMLELLTALPESARDEFESYVGSGDFEGMRKFVDKHVQNADELMQRIALNEYETIKTKIHMLEQGAQP